MHWYCEIREKVEYGEIGPVSRRYSTPRQIGLHPVEQGLLTEEERQTDRVVATAYGLTDDEAEETAWLEAEHVPTAEEEQPASDGSDLGAILRRVRYDLGLDPQAVADEAGVSRSSLLMTERGDMTPSFGALSRMLAALGVELVMRPQSVRSRVVIGVRTATE